MIGPGTTHHLVDAPVQSALRMSLLDDRRQLGLTGDRENDIADAPRWFIDRGAGDLDKQAPLSIDAPDVFPDTAHPLAFSTEERRVGKQWESTVTYWRSP